MIVSLIAAMARNRVIGKDGQLPWRLPEDLKRFKQLTMNKSYIVGRKTWDELGRALPGRDTIVITRDAKLRLDGATVVPSLDAALETAVQHAKNDEIMIGGGSQIFQAALPRADRLYLTVIDRDYEGDTRFPEFDSSQFRVADREPHAAAGDLPAFEFLRYERIRI